MWLWIIAALVLSYLPLINKKIELSNYMWLLVPIDAYGISVAGATIKPYMVFALILPLVFCLKNKGTDRSLSASKGQLFLGVISILIITVNLINCDNFSSVKAALMTLVVYICAISYTSCTDCENAEQLSDVFIASCFGCSAIFITAYVLLQSGLNIDGIVANVRADDGLFMKTTNMVSGKYTETLRLRGFAFDPNTMFVQFAFGLSACVSKLFKKFNLYYILTLLLSIICIILSSSRMGLLCCVVSIAVTSMICIIRFDSVKKKVLSAISMIAACAVFLIASISSRGQAIFSSLLSTYSNRSSLFDEYGRFSIWKESLSVYWEKNPLFGIGYNNMSLYTPTERMTHNTWLQFICEFGLIVGGIAVIYFLSVMILGWSKLKSHHRYNPDNTSYLTLVIGYTMTIVALVSVDNVTCSYLWFSALMILKMSGYQSRTKPLNKKTLR